MNEEKRRLLADANAANILLHSPGWRLAQRIIAETKAAAITAAMKVTGDKDKMAEALLRAQVTESVLNTLTQQIEQAAETPLDQ